jgi:hypothetical protein
MNVDAALTPRIAPHVILWMRSDGTPYDENDPDPEAHEEKHRLRPEHHLWRLIWPS